MNDARDRLMAAFQMPEGTGIFLMPSGSDAEYIPLLICKIFNQGKEIVSVVTCNEEVGSGTLDAAGGRFFSPMEPIKGFTNGEVKMSDPVEGMTEGVQLFQSMQESQRETPLMPEIKHAKFLRIANPRERFQLCMSSTGPKPVFVSHLMIKSFKRLNR